MLLAFDHRIDLGLGFCAVVGAGQRLLDGGGTGTGVLHQHIQGTQGLLKACPDTAIGPLEIQPQLVESLGQRGRAICGGLLGHGIDFA
ncbi:hypothetical protein D3C85_935900 [compost metagenome]